MKDSSNRTLIGVIVVCLLAVVVCLILGTFRKGEREESPPPGKPAAIAKPSPEPLPPEPSPPSPPAPEPEKKAEPSEPPEEMKDFDITGIVVDKSGSPLHAATVEALFYTWTDFSPENLDNTRNMKPLQYETKEDGRFGFRYQEGKRYFLRARKEDYVTAEKNLDSPQKDIVFTLTLGGAIEGKVVDAATRQPVTHFRILPSEDTRAGFALGIFKKKEVDICLPTEGTEFDNPDGNFRVSGLSEGKYELISVAEGYAQSYKRGVKVELEKTTSGVVIEQQPAGGIRGHVVDAIGKPIEAAEIVQKNPIHSSLFGEFPLPQRKILASSDSKGEFEMTGLPEGKFTLQARHTDYCPAQQEVKVNHGEVTENVEFQLVQGGRISGVVLAKADLQPVAGATVKATTTTTFIIPKIGAEQTETDPNGLFDIIKLEPGTYSLTVSAPDFAEKTVEDLVLKENEAITDLIIELSQGGSLVGTVRDFSGNPKPKQMVVAIGPGGQKTSQTDEQGDYAIANLKEGTYIVATIEMSGLTQITASRSSVYFTKVENDRETRLDMTVGGPHKVYGKVTLNGRPQPGVTVSVETTPQTVALNKKQSQGTDSTDENGRYEIDNLQPGQYNLNLMKMDANGVKSLFETEFELADSDLEKDIELPEGGISGKVVDADTHKPIEGAKVGGQRTRAKDIRSAAISKLGIFIGNSETTDSDGKYTFSVVEDGDYYLVASKEGYAPQALTAQVRNSQGPSNLDFSLTKGETLSGQVVGADPSLPIKQVFLTAQDSTGRTVHSERITLSETGDFQTTGLAPGEYTISVDASKYASASQKVTIRAGADNRADFTLTAGGTLIIRTIDEKGNPVPGVQTVVMDQHDNFFLGFFPDLQELINMGIEEMLQTDGVSVNRNLPQGTYRVKVSAIGYEDQFITATVHEGQQGEETVTLRKLR